MESKHQLLKQGQHLDHAKRTVLIAKMFDLLTQGYMSTYALSKQLHVTNKTIDKYRPLVDELIGKQKLDRNIIRNLELQRAYKVVELIMQDLAKTDDIRDRVALYGQIAKHSSRIALITGLNIETHVNVDHQQLVIIRADNNKRPSIEMENKPLHKK